MGILLLGYGLNNNRVTINVNDLPLLNLAKGFGFPSQDPTTVSSDGYPLTTPAVQIDSNPNMPAGYYDYFVWKFTGQGSMQIFGGPGMVFTAGSSSVSGA